MARASPVNISSIIAPTAVKARSVTAAGQLFAEPSWPAAAAFFVPSVREVRAVFRPDLLPRRNRNANRPIMATRKTPNHLKIGRDWQLAVDGKNRVAGRFCRQKTLLGSADESTSDNRFWSCVGVDAGSLARGGRCHRRYRRLRDR